MKKYLILPMAAMAAMVTACGGGDNTDVVDDAVDTTTATDDSISIMEVPYTMTFTDVSSTYSKLPTLHSYSMGQDNNGNMLLLVRIMWKIESKQERQNVRKNFAGMTTAPPFEHYRYLRRASATWSVLCEFGSKLFFSNDSMQPVLER